jgi:hypothetical protein
MKMKVTGTQKVELEISNSDLADAIDQLIIEKYFDSDFDDAGCDWLTENGEKVFIGNEEWEVSNNKNVAVLVDASNILRYGKRLVIE